MDNTASASQAIWYGMVVICTVFHTIYPRYCKEHGIFTYSVPVPYPLPGVWRSPLTGLLLLFIRSGGTPTKENDR
eukprot:500386-Pleurochrysis_carterae.AAC.3